MFITSTAAAISTSLFKMLSGLDDAEPNTTPHQATIKNNSLNIDITDSTGILSQNSFRNSNCGSDVVKPTVTVNLLKTAFNGSIRLYRVYGL